MKVLVCGGRDYSDKLRVWSVLHEIQADTPIKHLIEGGARGADAFAAEWATTTNGVQLVTCSANWDRDGKAAGPIRNIKMLELGVDLVVAFPGSAGTAHMVESARRRDIPVRKIA